MNMSQHCALVAVKAHCIMGYTGKTFTTKQGDVLCFAAHSINKPVSGALSLVSLPVLRSTEEMLTNGEDLAKTRELCHTTQPWKKG